MRKIIFMMSVSLDGFFEGPDRELDWQIVDEELHGHFNEWLSGMSAFLDGRVTYELMAGHWPTADADPSASPTVARASVEPIATAASRRVASGSTAVTRRAPSARAQAMVVRPTPPAPTTSTSSPGLTCALCTACRPTANGSTKAV